MTSHEIIVTSGTVVILTTCAPQDLKRKLSAFDEKRGPSMVTQVPEGWIGMLESSAACFKQALVRAQKGSSTGKWQIPGSLSYVPS